MIEQPLSEQLHRQGKDLRDLCRRFEIRELSLFGSGAHGKLRPDSDLDFLVEFEPGARIGFMALTKIAEELSALFRRQVDVVPKRGLKPLIRDQILDEAEVLIAA